MSYDNRINELALSKEESELAKQIARRKGISEEEAASLVLKASIERRVRRRTGKGAAKVYGFRRR